MKKKLIGYNIRILNDVVAKMTPAQLLLMCEIVGLLQVFDDSNGMTLLDALKKTVVEESNVKLYIAAFIHLGAGDDFKTFIERPFRSFFEQMSAQISLPFGTPQVGSVMQSPEHPIDFLYRICKDAMLNARIPTGVRLVRDTLFGRLVSSPISSSDPKSIWGNICPKHGEKCDGSNGKTCCMHPRMGDYSNDGRQMWWSFITECSQEFFFMFCLEYAKFVCEVTKDPSLLKKECESMMIPALPTIFKEIDFMKRISSDFSVTTTSDGSERIVPNPIICALTSSEKFNDMNVIFCKQILTILKHFGKAEMIGVFERLLEISCK
jgi:hypothetical protein